MSEEKTVKAVGGSTLTFAEEASGVEPGDKVEIYGSPKVEKIWEGARLLTVIETTLRKRGTRTEENPRRIVTEYWNLDGELLAEKDEFAEPVIQALCADLNDAESRVEHWVSQVKQRDKQIDALRKQVRTQENELAREASARLKLKKEIATLEDKVHELAGPKKTRKVSNKPATKKKTPAKKKTATKKVTKKKILVNRSR